MVSRDPDITPPTLKTVKGFALLVTSGPKGAETCLGYLVAPSPAKLQELVDFLRTAPPIQIKPAMLTGATVTVNTVPKAEPPKAEAPPKIKLTTEEIVARLSIMSKRRAMKVVSFAERFWKLACEDETREQPEAWDMLWKEFSEITLAPVGILHDYVYDEMCECGDSPRAALHWATKLMAWSQLERARRTERVRARIEKQAAADFRAIGWDPLDTLAY